MSINWKTELQDQVIRDFVDKAGFEKLLSEKGIGNDDTVVLYGGNNNWFAAYAYWYFTLYGHDRFSCSTAVARNGSWTAASCPGMRRPAGHQLLRAGAGQLDPRVPPGDDRCDRHQEPGRRPFARRVLRQDPRACPPAAGAAQRPGHIPTALNVPWSKTANEDGTFKTDDEIAEIYRKAGLDTSKATIAYCRIGERSSHSWFVLHELLGHADVKNYDGSWTEYGSLVGVPIELGAGVPMCGAPEQAQLLPPATDLTKQTVLVGTVSRTAGRFPRSVPSCGCWTAPANSPPRWCPPRPGIPFLCRPRYLDHPSLTPLRTGETTVTAGTPGLFLVDVTVS